MTIQRKFLAAALLGLSLAAFGGACSKGPAEKVGEKIDNAVDASKEKAKEITKDIKKDVNKNR